MTVTWKIDDGYVGHGSHEVDVPDEEIKDCGSPEAARKLIEDYVRHDFRDTARWCFEDYSDMNAEIDRLLAECKEDE